MDKKDNKNLPYLFTFVIGYRHKPDRINNLKRVLDWINGFSGVEVILVEQDKHPKIDYLNLKAKYIFTKSELPYNNSWALNVATKYSNSSIIVYGNCDVIMNPYDFIESLKAIDEYDMVNPHTRFIDLTPEESLLPFDKIFQINRPGRGELDNQKTNLCSGICIFKKEAVYKIGGWNEDFIGWGGEDDYQSIKVENFLKYIEMPYNCYHFYHARENINMMFYQRSLDILQKFSSMSKEDMEKIITNPYILQKIGLKNKYDI